MQPADTLVLDVSGRPLAAFAARDEQWREPLKIEQVSPHLLKAIVAVEDARFYQHGGVDWRSVTGAAWEDVRGLSVRRGASTLTMQVQRLRDPRPRTFWNKFDQAIRAEQLEQRQSKRAILLEYVNGAPFGGNLAGAGAASRRYFGKPCAALSLGEAALLAGIPQAPARLRADRFPQRAMTRRNHVLDRMLALGAITSRQHDEAAAEPVNALWRPLPQDRPSRGDAPADGGLPTLTLLATHTARDGGTLRTTLDANVQRTACRIASDAMEPLHGDGVTAAAVVVLDTAHSRCEALVSLTSSVTGRGADAIDLTRSARSTGSVLKPFIYAAAFDAGICTPATLLDDSPTAWPGYLPADYDRRFRGPLPAAEALAESRNVPAMVLLSRVGVEPTVGLLETAGLQKLGRTPDRYGLSLAIGGAEATPLEIATAYAALARGGRCAEAIIFLPPAGTSAAQERPVHFLPPSACWQVLGALSDPERTSRVCREAAPTRAAWKTGTSSGHRDAWCAAVTPRHTVVVWVGNPAGEGSPALVGAEAAAPIALRLIAALEPDGNLPWTRVAPPQPIAEAPTAVHALSAAAPGVTLVSPTSGQSFILDPTLPSARQRVLLHGVAGSDSVRKSDARSLWWFVDGQPLVATPNDGDRTWWQPTPGSHEIRVVDSAGHSASATIQVLSPGP